MKALVAGRVHGMREFDMTEPTIPLGVRRLAVGVPAMLGALLAGAGALAQPPSGEDVFTQSCAICHVDPPQENIPPLEALRGLDPNAIVESLTDGTMRLQGSLLDAAEQAAVAEFITGRPVRAASAASVAGLCPQDAPLPTLEAGQHWNGWGGNVRNARYQADAGGITAGNVGRLELKWAFGIPDATQSRAQPAVIGGRLFMGSQTGSVYALDAATGCTYWTFEAQAGVRTAISVGPIGGRYAVYFADANARAYAVDAETGREIWNRKVDEHPAARATGAPTLYAGRLYVPVSGVSEETAASMPGYECCTFRGSISALDAATGEVVWKTYTVDEPRPRGRSSAGKPLWGPAGAPIWSAATVDARRGLLYAATGNAYADPPPPTSDSIIAFSLATGAIEWVRQVEPGDVWILGCDEQSTGDPNAGENPNCPGDVGPDFDFSASPVLTTLADGSDRLVVTQKSGVGFALDPDDRGAIVWEYRWGTGSPVGGVWGTASDGRRAYFPVADQLTPAPGGLHAVDVVTGERLWYVPPQEPLCPAGPGCSAAQSAAVTAIPGVVFSGSADGGMRAYAAADGEILWTYDTNRAFETVNDVAARGGSIDGPGPVVAGGMLFVTAGNAGFVGTPGNVLLAFVLE
jgi:polyvinyl alcohol dehydrogenase (cytochrome)